MQSIGFYDSTSSFLENKKSVTAQFDGFTVTRSDSSEEVSI